MDGQSRSDRRAGQETQAGRDPGDFAAANFREVPLPRRQHGRPRTPDSGSICAPARHTYLATAPGEHGGWARAIRVGDVEPHGVHPGRPVTSCSRRWPTRWTSSVRLTGADNIRSLDRTSRPSCQIAPPPQEVLPRCVASQKGGGKQDRDRRCDPPH